MKNKSLLIFAVITLGAILAAMLVWQNRAPTSSLEKQPLFADLSGKVNEVHRLRLQQHEESLTLVKNGDMWVIEEADNYPADFARIRESVIAVSKLMILSRKTSNPDLYPRLGVEDPLSEKANSTLLKLEDNNGAELASLIVGNSRHSKSAESLPGLYVRLPDADTALLVEGRLDASVDIKQWFNRDLLDIDGARISKIAIEHKQGPLVSLHRAEDIDDFSLDNIPADKDIQSPVIITRMSTMLESLSVDGVTSESRIKDHISSTTQISTFDGLEISISNAVLEDKSYASFSFSSREVEVADEPEDVAAGEGDTDEKPSVADEAGKLNQQMSGWAYAIPDYKFELFTRALADLVREKQADKEETPPAE